MKQEIITYLAGPRNFIQGVELYEKYGINLSLIHIWLLKNYQRWRDSFRRKKKRAYNRKKV